MMIRMENVTEMAQELTIEVEERSDFFMSGAQKHTVLLSPLETRYFATRLIPLLPGNLTLPKTVINCARLKTQYIVPIARESKVFIHN